MLRARESALVLLLLLAAVLVTGSVRLRLDALTASFRDDFQSMTYLPRGEALKIVAAGFDAPLADALFVKGMIYYPGTLKQTGFADESKLYIYELFNLVTDLSPRFYRAYQVGALFLTASASLETNRQGLRLLQKGVDFYDNLEAEGKAVAAGVDPRWLFHCILATTFDVNIQARLREAGDVEGASAARIEAGRHFRLAALSPGAPEYIIMAARGFESVLKGRGDIAAARAAVLSVWEETYNQAVRRGDEDLAERLKGRMEAAGKELEAILLTRRLEAALSEAGAGYLRAKGRPAADIEELRRTGFIRAVPAAWPLDEIVKEAGERDAMLALPDGGFRSRVLAAWETREHLNVLLDGAIAYRRTHGSAPPDLATLVRERILEAIPAPPLAGLGQRYVYDRESGATHSTPEELFQSPPGDEKTADEQPGEAAA